MALASVVGIAVSGCSVSGTPASESSRAHHSSSTPLIRQTDDAGRQLPFRTTFPNRWSINNDGTSYEPCTQVSESVVRQFGLDVESVSDVAGSDFQTARGCQWTFANNRLSFLSQSVGNMLSPDGGLSAHKEEYSPGVTWLPDIEIVGRHVLLGSMAASDCGAYVTSGTAVVVTSIVRIESNPPRTEDICATAADFLRATMKEIPK
ncbi:DUF3558 domain-containing protein [Gordonia jinghuaiqii]|uniref:DUF3558 domain-containing protein n=2 Tax=Gordonia jinghuaiqii TaxID=2758710 RepID=A0A7D7LUR8_9ACTN|nr:DUF3558 family protein [Gordonia jinghuaiqii]MCR5976575.1 DUF3558 domain-containing protein [Gordonia jinghuaiqii]QMT03883.1 DUF3558 domain-containing protein [Gordonia jinghuaiqii]